MELFLFATLGLAIAAYINAYKALKENTKLRIKLNELLYDKKSKEKELAQHEKIYTANKDPDKTVPIPVPPVTSPQPKTNDEKEIANIDLKIWIEGNTHKANEPIKVCLSAKDKDGIESWAQGKLTLIKLSESTLLPVKVISSSLIELNPLVESTHRLSFNAPEPGLYRLKLTLNDTNLSTIHEFSVKESALKSTQESAPISSDSETLKTAAETPKSRSLVRTAKEKVKGPDKRTGETPNQSALVKTKLPTPKGSDSIEMKLGTYWFVRIGVILLLTGIASLAWFNRSFFFDLNPGIKVGLFYALSAVMSGLGFWIQKRKEELKNYGQVLMAGGFAGTYFTTYAAHIFEPVKIIYDPTIALVLLFSLGMLIVWFADKLKSETIALFAIGASYYATYVPVIHSGEISPWIILASNLILAVSSVIFMLRNRWFKMPALSMVASYSGFFIWRSMTESPELFLVAIFASSLWVVYTVAGLLSRDNGFKDNERATFLTLNNGALFGLMSWELLKNADSKYWILPLSLGVLLVGCAFFASRALKNHPLTKNCYLIQGLTLITLGLMVTKQSESIKGPILAAESVILLFGAIRLKSLIAQYASVAAAAAAVIFGFISIASGAGDYFYSCLSIGGFLIFNAFLTSKKIEHNKEILLRPIVSCFTASALAISISAFLVEADYSLMTGLILIASSVIFCASIYPLRVREFVLLGQIPAIFGIIRSYEILADTKGFGTEPLILLLLTLGLAHWWSLQKNRFIAESEPDREQANGISFVFEILYSGAIISQLLIWLVATHQYSPDWLWIGSVTTVAITAYSAMTRAKFIGSFSQIFLALACVCQINICIYNNEGTAIMAMIPIATMLGTSLIIPYITKLSGTVSKSMSRTFGLIQRGYRLASTGLLMLWIYRFVPGDSQLWISVVLSFACIIAGKWRPAAEWGWLSLAFSLSGLIYLFAGESNPIPIPDQWITFVCILIGIAFFFTSLLVSSKETLISFTAYVCAGYISIAGELLERNALTPSLMAVLLLLIVQQISRRVNGKIAISDKVHFTLIISGVVTLFLWATAKVGSDAEGLRTITWAGLAVIYFILGLSLKERWYRLTGLGTLGIALLSLLPIIWGLSTEMKIASLFVLGAIFVGLGYVYTRYRERINKLL
ncbi:DUF2339 domain-containing protein [Verrucomicrobiales bacterium]|nr:DUF2339 domain-containing protein [Verrucomicrobiales bacterium]